MNIKSQLEQHMTMVTENWEPAPIGLITSLATCNLHLPEFYHHYKYFIQIYIVQDRMWSQAPAKSSPLICMDP